MKNFNNVLKKFQPLDQSILRSIKGGSEGDDDIAFSVIGPEITITGSRTSNDVGVSFAMSFSAQFAMGSIYDSSNSWAGGNSSGSGTGGGSSNTPSASSSGLGAGNTIADIGRIIVGLGEAVVGMTAEGVTVGVSTLLVADGLDRAFSAYANLINRDLNPNNTTDAAMAVNIGGQLGRMINGSQGELNGALVNDMATVIATGGIGLDGVSLSNALAEGNYAQAFMPITSIQNTILTYVQGLNPNSNSNNNNGDDNNQPPAAGVQPVINP